MGYQKEKLLSKGTDIKEIDVILQKYKTAQAQMTQAEQKALDNMIDAEIDYHKEKENEREEEM